MPFSCLVWEEKFYLRKKKKKCKEILSKISMVYEQKSIRTARKKGNQHTLTTEWKQSHSNDGILHHHLSLPRFHAFECSEDECLVCKFKMKEEKNCV